MNEPLVEFSVYAYNQWQNTLRLLDSLKKTSYSNYSITVIDNASTDQTVNEIEKISDIKIIHNDKFLSFAACHNKVMSQSPADFICIITPEIKIISEDWLTKLVSYMKNGVEIVSPAKKINEKLLIGGKIRDDATCINIYDNDKVEWFHSCCFLIKKELIETIGVFDERFLVRYYEDIDFCLRAQEAGFNIVCATDVLVEFYDNELTQLKKQQEANRVLFVEKHKDWLLKFKGKAVKRKRRYQRDLVEVK